MEIVSRDRWGSVSKFKYGDMKLPASNVYLHHTVTTPTDYPYRDAKVIEKIGISRFGQISYSYLIHPDGTILEGAGTKTGAHTEGRNSTSFGIALIGDYSNVHPTDAQILSFRWLVHYLKATQNWLVDAAVVTPHRAVKATSCPGNQTMLVLDEFREPWEVSPMYAPALDLEPIVAHLRSPHGGVWLLAASGAVYAFDAPYYGAANGQSYFVGRTAALLEPNGDGYTIVSVSNERYSYGP